MSRAAAPRGVLAVVLAGTALTLALDVGAAARAADEIEDLLAREAEATLELAHRGDVTIVAFGERGPTVTELTVERRADVVAIDTAGRSPLGPGTGAASLQRTDRLLRVPGLTSQPLADRMRHEKYDWVRRGVLRLDTGPAHAVEVVERASERRREVLYLDVATGLIVRRETYDAAGSPVRVVAYTRLEVLADGAPEPRRGVTDAPGTREPSRPVADLRAAGFEVPDVLGAGYRLVAAKELVDTPAATVHLLYTDGLYTLSVFQQQGRLATAARAGAVALPLGNGGTVWRWPGSEPRQVVWTGAGLTFTALTDAPVDDLVAAIDRLPSDPPPGLLDRVTRGLQRVTSWLAALWGAGPAETPLRSPA